MNAGAAGTFSSTLLGLPNFCGEKHDNTRALSIDSFLNMTINVMCWASV